MQKILLSPIFTWCQEWDIFCELKTKDLVLRVENKEQRTMLKSRDLCCRLEICARTESSDLSNVLESKDLCCRLEICAPYLCSALQIVRFYLTVVSYDILDRKKLYLYCISFAYIYVFCLTVFLSYINSV